MLLEGVVKREWIRRSIDCGRELMRVRGLDEMITSKMGQDSYWSCQSRGTRRLSYIQDVGLTYCCRRRQSLVEAVPDSEVEFQEQLIQEREGEIEEIEQGITELNQIFRDLAQIVGDQGDSISESQSILSTLLQALMGLVFVDDISSNIFSVVRDTERAGTELTQASDYQRKAGRRMLCLLLVFFVVLAIVLLAVRALRRLVRGRR